MLKVNVDGLHCAFLQNVLGHSWLQVAKVSMGIIRAKGEFANAVVTSREAEVCCLLLRVRKGHVFRGCHPVHTCLISIPFFLYVCLL